MTTLSHRALNNVVVCALFVTANLGFLSIGSISLSLPIGAIVILLYSALNYKLVYSVKKHTLFLLLFTIVACTSLMFSPIGISGKSIYSVVQILYWFFLANFVINVHSTLNKGHIGKTIIILLIALLFSVLTFKSITSENEIAYIIVGLWPFGLMATKRKLIKLFYITFIIIFSGVNGSRTGMLVVLLQALLLFAINIMPQKIISRLFIIFLCILVFLSIDTVRFGIADHFFKREPIVSELIKDPTLPLSLDKSWVQRKLQNQKNLQIFKEYPIFGIGLYNPQNYNVSIKVSEIENVNDAILENQYKDSFNRSAHNSYYEILASMGVLGIILLLCILFRPLWVLFKTDICTCDRNYALASIFGLIINLYMVSSFFGTHTFVLIAFIIATMSDVQKIKL